MDSPLIDFPYVSTDVETTGLNPDKDEILSVTVTEFNLSGMVGKSITEMCRPMSGFVPIEASNIHGITYDMVQDKPNYFKDGVREKIALFIGSRTVVGHNIIDFDIKFLKLKVKAMEDTLVMCRQKYGRGGNSLKVACKRINIKWDAEKAHGSLYDSTKALELFVKMKHMDSKTSDSQIQLFSQPAVSVSQVEKSIEDIGLKPVISDKKFGIAASDEDKNLIATQAYSFSRINMYLQCAFKWYMTYVKKIKDPGESYLLTGNICHKIAEKMSNWCYRELFINKFIAYYKMKNVSLDQAFIKKLAEVIKKQESEITIRDAAESLCDKPMLVREHLGKGLSTLIHEIDSFLPENTYEKPSKPDYESFENMVSTSINEFKCIDVDVIKDVRWIMGRFYEKKDFSLMVGDIRITEKKFAYDKYWKPVGDFYGNNVFFRAIVDVIGYHGSTIIITDYKSSRTMMTEQELKEDMQLKIYVYMVYLLMPRNSYNRIVVRIEYLRFCQTVEVVIDNIDQVVKEAEEWIRSSVKMIESELLKTSGTSFAPIRNQYCHTCHIGEDGMCPLFNKLTIDNIDDPFSFIIGNKEDCVKAWKRVEANKAENSRLTKMCKQFVEKCEDPIIIDEKAKLNFYTSESLDYDSAKTLTLLLQKGADIQKIIKHFGISQSEMEKLLEANGLTISQEELNFIAYKKTRNTFDAFVPEEIEGKYLNS